MRTSDFLSYMKSKPIRIKFFIPWEISGLGLFVTGLILSTLVFLVSTSWGALLYTITAVSFYLANAVKNVEAGQVMITIRFNKPSNKVHEKGICFIAMPFWNLCNFYTINFVREEKEMRNLETSGDGYRMGYAYVLKTKINRSLVYLYEDDILRGKEQDVMQALNDALLEASKNEVKRYSHKQLVEDNTYLQETLKADIETNFLSLFGDSLYLLCGHRDLYEVDLTIVNLIFDEDYMSKLKEKNQAKMDAEIAEFDKKATITDAEAKAEATKVEGKAKAEAQQMLFDTEVKRVEELKKQLGSAQAVADYFKWLNSNLTVEGGGGSGHGPGIIIDPRGGK